MTMGGDGGGDDGVDDVFFCVCRRGPNPRGRPEEIHKAIAEKRAAKKVKSTAKSHRGKQE